MAASEKPEDGEEDEGEEEMERDELEASSAYKEESEEEENEECEDGEDADYRGDVDDDEEEADRDGRELYESSAGRLPPSDDVRKSQNVAALVRGNLLVRRQPLIPRILSVSDGAAVARKPFKPPCADGYRSDNNELTRRLWVRKRFVPWGSSRTPLVAITNLLHTPSFTTDDPSEKDQSLPPGIESLVLWQTEGEDEGNADLARIEVDPLLVRYLRPHQREGVQFMFECVSGLSGSDGISGCILADDMGLGKTLQSITLLYTLLRQGFDGKPMVERVVIVTPTSLVSNWESEINKWIGGKVQVIALCESTRADVLSGIGSFLKPHSSYQVLIISYETFRMHSSKFEKSGSCDLLICDEAHRLKNDQTLTNKALAALPCKKRILLSGTPMQNDLEEFFAMVNFTNPGILGDAAYFRRYYETPIIVGREPMATPEERKLGAERSAELSAKVNQFILRRTNSLLSNHLPPKIVEVVCCKLTPLQLELYKHFIQSKNVKHAITAEAKQSKILAYITALKKLCNHPKLIYDTIKSGNSGTSGFDDCLRLFPTELFSGRSGTWTGGGGMWVELSGKMHVLARLLGHLRQKTDDRIVLVSNYTQTLDLFAQLCKERRYPYVRLDGTTSIGKRQKLVNRFNDPSKDEFVFLLSSKAGGCGLNLIGGNRLVLFDPDWNPANDKQAAARVWRDGQKKRVYIYRFLSTGTIEEKVYQRQMSKEGLQQVIQHEQAEGQIPQGSYFSAEDLRDLFTFHEHARSEIHANMNCTRCSEDGAMMTHSTNNGSEINDGSHSVKESNLANQVVDDIGGFAVLAGCYQKLKRSQKQLGTPSEENLGDWGHHADPATVADAILQSSAGDEVTFVFTNQVDGKLVPVESTLRSTSQQPDEQNYSRQKDGKLTLLHKQLKLQSSPVSEIVDLKSPGMLGSSLLKGSSKLARPSPKSLRLIRKPGMSCGNQSPFKRTCMPSVSDEDFI